MPSAGITGTLEVFAAAKPNRMLVKISLGGVGEVMEGFDGVNAWSMSPMTGAMVLQGKQLEDKKFDSEFYGELHEGSRYQSLKTLERTTFDGRPCYKVSLVRPGGSEDFEFYDVATGLKAGSINTRETQMGSITTTSIEADYRKFGNVLQATTLRQNAMASAGAALALGRVGTPAGRAALERAGDDDQPMVRNAVARALRQEAVAQ